MISAHHDEAVRDRLTKAYRAARELSEVPPLTFGADLRALWVWSRIDFTGIRPDELVRVIHLLGNLAENVDRYCGANATAWGMTEKFGEARMLLVHVNAALTALVEAVDDAADAASKEDGE